MKRIAIGLLCLAGGCGGDGGNSSGVHVWRCDAVIVRNLLDVGSPPAVGAPIQFVPSGAPGECRGWAAVDTSGAAGGSLEVVDLATFVVREVASTSADAASRYADRRLYVIDRAAGSIQALDTENDFAPVGEAISVGAGTDPQDICCVSREECYVTLLSDPHILILNPEAKNQADRMLGSIDLTSLDDDGNPNSAACLITGSRLAVALRRLDDGAPDLAPRSPGRIAFVDLAADPPVVASTLDTVAPDPSTRFLPQSGGTALIGERGESGATDGVIELVDLTNRASLGARLTEQELGGDLLAFDKCTTSQVWALAETATGTALHPVELGTAEQPGHARPPPLETEGSRLTGVSADPCGRIWMGESTSASP
jgi:hypothetical protein